MYIDNQENVIIIAVTAHWWRGNPIYDGVILALAVSAIAVVLNQAFTKGPT